MTGRRTRSTTRGGTGRDENNNAIHPVQRSPKVKVGGRGHGQLRIDKTLKPTRNVRGHGRAYKLKRSSSCDSAESVEGVGTPPSQIGINFAGNEIVLIGDSNYVPGTIPPEFADCETEETPSTSRKDVDQVATVSATATVSLAVETLQPEEREGVLKDFDLNSLYGACRGMTRFDRFKRAIRFNLQPPPSPTVFEVLNNLENEQEKKKKPEKDDGMLRSCIWDQNPLLGRNF